jgi:hypothetical protein
VARGRRPQGAYRGKGSVLSTRITPELRQELEAAAQAKGHSLSQEIEHRLRRSFEEDRGIIERFGNRRNYAVLRLIASYMDVLYKPGDLNASWLDDPYVFAQLEKALALTVEQLRPPGDATPPVQDALALAPDTFQGAQIGAAWLQAVKTAEAGVLPITTSEDKRLAAHIRSDLGEIADRITAKPDDGRSFGLWLQGVVPRQEGETDDAYRRRAVATILDKRKKGESL